MQYSNTNKIYVQSTLVREESVEAATDYRLETCPSLPKVFLMALTLIAPDFP